MAFQQTLPKFRRAHLSALGCAVTASCPRFHSYPLAQADWGGKGAETQTLTPAAG